LLIFFVTGKGCIVIGLQMKEETIQTSVSHIIAGIAHLKIKQEATTGDIMYEFIEVNPAFQALSGAPTSIVGKNLPEVLPHITVNNTHWINLFNDVTINGENRQVNFFSSLMQREYTLHVSSPAAGLITMIVTENNDAHPPKEVIEPDDKSLTGTARFINLERQLADYKEQSLKRKKMLRAYFDANPTATYVWSFKDNDFYLEEINQTALKQTQNRVTQFIGQSSQQIYPDVPIIREKMFECYHSRNTVEFEINYRTRYSGKYEWVKFTIVNLEQGKILFFTDTITKQKKAENDLIRAKERADENMAKYRTLYLHAPLSFQSLDENACIIDVNPMWLSVLGYDRMEVIGAWFGSFLHPDCLPVFEKGFPLYKKRGYISGIEFKMRKGNGTYIDVLYEGRIGYSSEGEFIQTYCVFTDITQQKHYEETLKQRERLLNRAQQLSKVGGWEWDVEKQLMTWTDETYRIHGVEPGIFISGSLERILTSSAFYKDEDQKCLMQAFASCIREGKPFELELPLTSITGTIKCVVIKAEPIYQNNQVIKITGNIQDITEQKRAEEERLEKEKLEKKITLTEESLRFKQNFLANMSHEMRTPLTGILGMAEILSKSQLDNEQKDYLDTIIQSGENLREIINNVLDFSKIEAGKINLKKNTFSLENLQLHTRKLFNSLCRKPIEFESVIDEDVPVLITADETRIKQVINNLLFNAVKFTASGKIGLYFKMEKRLSLQREMEIKVLVTDTGKGINADTLEKLFIPFSQIEDKDTRDFEGTGLGLSICKDLVKLHGGNIGVISHENQGSTFWFTFIAEEAELEQPEKVIIPPAPLENPRTLNILLAEDKVVNQKVIKLILSSMGHKITIARNGLEVLKLFRPSEFDLVLMDIQMPEMDGIQATQKLRELYPDLPPIVGLSANAFEGDREKYMAQGLDEYLIKPLKTEDFNAMVIKFFSKKKQFDSF
jgi:PAS domain S-box-containing protein